MLKNPYQLSIVTLLILTIFACKNDRINYAIISGKVDNGSQLILKASFGSKNTDKFLKLDKNGAFLDTIYTKEGLYNIFDGKNLINFYIKPSKEYVIHYDANNFKNQGMELGGNDVLFNQFYIKKSQNREFVNLTSTSEESKFREYLNAIKTKQIAAIDSSKLSKQLKIDEKLKVGYQYLKDLKLFLYYAGIKEPTEQTKRELDIDYNNEAHYQKYGPYNSLVYEHYAILLSDNEKKRKKTDSSYSKHQDVFQFYAKNISNELIRNGVIQLDAVDFFKQAKNIKKYYQDFKKYYTGKDSLFLESMLDSYTNLTKIEKGTESPKFTGYKNFKGGNNSLVDFVGKPVYINLWATWCNNCYGQMEPLKKLVKDYDNVEFLSIAYQDKEKLWRSIVAKNKLGGTQLFADESDESFFEAYGVYGVPRYILLDKEGKIIDYNAPSPSDSKLKRLLTELGN